MKTSVPAPTAIAIFISIAALAMSFGTIRWSVLMLDEQLRLRNEFEQLNQQQNQVNLQYEAWLELLQQERQDLENLMNAQGR